MFFVLFFNLISYFCIGDIMENFTIEKSIEFNSKIENVESLYFDDNIKYKVEDEFHVEGCITLKGNVKTVLNTIPFEEDVIVDLFAPVNKVIDQQNFKINIVDYSYVIKDSKLIVYLIINFDGLLDNDFKETKIETENNDYLKQMNEINEIKENRDNEIVPIQEVINENKLLLKENIVSDNVNKTWATDLFKLNDNYSLFMKVHIDEK